MTVSKAVLGGALIGGSAGLLLFLSGRIAGISGITAALLPGAGVTDRTWRLFFVLGLFAAGISAHHFSPELFVSTALKSKLTLICAGLLVGVGSRLAGGCTSGHGICGVARSSSRSWVATAIFTLAGIVTVALVRHGLGGQT